MYANYGVLHSGLPFKARSRNNNICIISVDILRSVPIPDVKKIPTTILLIFFFYYYPICESRSYSNAEI